MVSAWSGRGRPCWRSATRRRPQQHEHVGERRVPVSQCHGGRGDGSDEMDVVDRAAPGGLVVRGRSVEEPAVGVEFPTTRARRRAAPRRARSGGTPAGSTPRRRSRARGRSRRAERGRRRGSPGCSRAIGRWQGQHGDVVIRTDLPAVEQLLQALCEPAHAGGAREERHVLGDGAGRENASPDPPASRRSRDPRTRSPSRPSSRMSSASAAASRGARRPPGHRAGRGQRRPATRWRRAWQPQRPEGHRCDAAQRPAVGARRRRPPRRRRCRPRAPAVTRRARRARTPGPARARSGHRPRPPGRRGGLPRRGDRARVDHQLPSRERAGHLVEHGLAGDAVVQTPARRGRPHAPPRPPSSPSRVRSGSTRSPCCRCRRTAWPWLPPSGRARAPPCRPPVPWLESRPCHGMRQAQGSRVSMLFPHS